MTPWSERDPGELIAELWRAGCKVYRLPEGLRVAWWYEGPVSAIPVELVAEVQRREAEIAAAIPSVLELAEYWGGPLDGKRDPVSPLCDTIDTRLGAGGEREPLPGGGWYKRIAARLFAWRPQPPRGSQ